ncbi:hypothetical protein ABZ341_18005 [Streptomyces sp. NPDC006173]|uniref:hypothetical protein n=1 Tax=Streptomyces sp. NPDC006173 TaxID=3155349 RepID=UPI0033CFF029
MSLTIPFVGRRDRRRHSPDQVIRKLREDIAKLMNRQAAADDFFVILTADREHVYAAWEFAETARQEAEMVAACLQAERDELLEECAEWRVEAQTLSARLAPFLAAEANATRVTVPQMVRDTSAFEDQATAPIDVRELRERFASGPVVSLHHSPQAGNPAHVPSWAVTEEAVAR